METRYSYNMFDRRQPKEPGVKWFREWVPQDVISTGGKCMVLKWVNEGTLKAMKEESEEPQHVEPQHETKTEVLFLCSFESCGKTFIDAGALRKHSHIHGEKQYVCHYENCGKKFLDTSKLKRHFLIHTGERHYVCPHEGCGKAFSLDFNLRSHMKTHSQQNYHVCPYPDCGKQYAHAYKLRNHVASHQAKSVLGTVKYTPPVGKTVKIQKSSTGALGPTTAERPHACPYEGCNKAYIHEYKLNLHLRRQHIGHFPDENANKNTQIDNGNETADEGSDHDAFSGKPSNGKVQKQNRSKPNLKLPPSKVARCKNFSTTPPNLNLVKRHWPSSKEETYEDEDSEETEEERENVGEGWRYAENNEDDDEETEDED